MPQTNTILAQSMSAIDDPQIRAALAIFAEELEEKINKVKAVVREEKPLAKFNPYHDSQGRFSAADAGIQIHLPGFEKLADAPRLYADFGVYDTGTDVMREWGQWSFSTKGGGAAYVISDEESSRIDTSMTFLRKAIDRNRSTESDKSIKNNRVNRLTDPKGRTQAFIYAPIFTTDEAIDKKFAQYTGDGDDPDIYGGEPLMIIDFLGVAPWNIARDVGEGSPGWGAKAMYVAAVQAVEAKVTQIALLSADEHSDEFYSAIGMHPAGDITDIGQRWFSWQDDDIQDYINRFEKKYGKQLIGNHPEIKPVGKSLLDLMLDDAETSAIVTTRKMAIIDGRLKARGDKWTSTDV